MAQWQNALDSLKGQNITSRLKELAEQKPIAFRRLLSIVFEPNSLRVRTEHKGRKWVGVLENNRLTEAMLDMSVSFSNNPR
jgi:hypothetical protein